MKTKNKKNKSFSVIKQILSSGSGTLEKTVKGKIIAIEGNI